MSGFGPETVIVVLVILLVFGSKKIPEMARGIGQAKAEFEKGQRETTDDDPQAS